MVSINDKATHELARSLAKEDFEQMEVLGQFNRGFIIAKLRDDLFIVDQHACDEKHNFETMQANTKLHTQRMVNSMPLEVQTPIQPTQLLLLCFLSQSHHVSVYSGKCGGGTGCT